MTAASRKRIEQGKTRLAFRHRDGSSYSHDPANPEAAIAYDQDKVLSTLRHLGLAPKPPHYGYWATPSGLAIATRG